MAALINNKGRLFGDECIGGIQMRCSGSILIYLRYHFKDRGLTLVVDLLQVICCVTKWGFFFFLSELGLVLFGRLSSEMLQHLVVKCVCAGVCGCLDRQAAILEPHL